MSLLFGYRHQEMLLGMNEVPNAEQQHRATIQKPLRFLLNTLTKKIRLINGFL